MERWKESQLRQIASATEVDIAYQGALSFAKNIGYKFFEFSATYITKPDQLNTLKLNNYPASRNKENEQKKLRDVDPVMAQCNKSMLPNPWSEKLFSKNPSNWEEHGGDGIQPRWLQSVE